MKALRNLLYVLIATTLAGLFQSCINDNYPMEDPATDDNSVYLVLHIGLATPTRASNLSNELMHTLRIVLLDENGDIEYNKRVEDLGKEDLGNGVSEYGYHFISTKTGKKKIYLIANEGCVNEVNGGTQSLTDLLDKLTNGNASDDLDNIYFTPVLHGTEQRIPISAYYEFEITEEELKASNSRQAKREFDLVYAATKFEIRFENYLTTSVTINNLSISSVADDMYLFAHFDKGNNETTLLKTMPAAQGGRSWIEWLKEVSEETTANPNLPDNEDINNAYGWLTDYVLPTNTHNELAITQSTDNNTIGGRTNENTPGKFTFTRYTTESKYIPQEGTEQKYTLDVTLTSNDNNQTKTFTSQEIPNLRTLFRNTHAIVTVSIYGISDITLQVMLRPWDTYTSGDITFH